MPLWDYNPPADEDKELEELQKEIDEEPGDVTVNSTSLEEDEFEDAEVALNAKNEDQKDTKEEDIAKRYQDILVGLGFKLWDNDGEIKCSILEGGLKIGRTFNTKTPCGKLWAYPVDSNNKKSGEFLSIAEIKELPIIQHFYKIRDGAEPIPDITVSGKIIEKRGKAILIQFEEQGEEKTVFFGGAAVKNDEDGFFIPKGYSKKTEKHAAKMAIPRDIRLPNYEEELQAVPITQPTGNEVAQQEYQPIDREGKKRQMAEDMRWAAQTIRDIYLEEIKDKVEMQDTEQFIEKGMITFFIEMRGERGIK